MLCPRNHCQIQCHKVFSYVFLQKFYSFSSCIQVFDNGLYLKLVGNWAFLMLFVALCDMCMYRSYLLHLFFQDHMTCDPVKLSLPWSPVLLLRNHLVSGFLGNSAGEEFICNAGDPRLIPGSGSSPGEGIGYPLQYSCLENSMNRGAWWAMVHGVAKSQT